VLEVLGSVGCTGVCVGIFPGDVLLVRSSRLFLIGEVERGGRVL
jgi:hypothetical protein